jgi:hypothetical protein
VHRLQPEFGRIPGGAVNTYHVGYARPARQWLDAEARLVVSLPAAGTSKMLRVNVCRFSVAASECR